jgi:hypothetical protein
MGERITAEEVGQSPDRPRGRQAVLVIHGIGDQKPMDTLRDFVNGLYPTGPGEAPHVFSKPDPISEVLDLRRLAAYLKDLKHPTDFYELYWAHLMEGSTLGHVRDWFFMLLRRPPSAVPLRLQKIWLVSWVLVLGAITFAIYQAYSGRSSELLVNAGLLGLLLYFSRGILSKIALGYLADAARYLRPAPENIGIRQAIRTAGIAVLRRLHNDPLQRYDRIVIVGHSLGSVIAYDILTHLWQEMHWVHTKPENPRQPVYDEMKSRLVQAGGCAAEIESYRILQRKLLCEEQSLGMPWKVTDLVTVGSPLTYADFLLADRPYPLARRQQDRELPTCPPQLEDARDIGFLSQSYRLGDGTLAQKKLLHHAALFACTRWTNVYFRADIIGGPLSPSFGCGVMDVRVAGRSALSETPMSHVRYWHAGEPLACKAIRDAMSLE